MTTDNQYTIQVRFDIYGLNINSTNIGWYRYSNLTPGQVWKTALPNPTTVRRYPSLVNFCNDYIFVIGGQSPDDSEQVYDTVEKFDIKEEKWSSAPSMKLTRLSHSSCTLSNKWIYTFGGYDKDFKFIDAIERLDATRAVLGGNSNSTFNSSWEYVKFEGTNDQKWSRKH